MYRRPCDVGPDESRATSQGRQALAASCRDCSAVWLLWERIRIAWCTDYIAAAAPPPNLGGIEKTQMRTLAWHGMPRDNQGETAASIRMRFAGAGRTE